jgi:chemotaxis protein MotA
MVLDRELQYSKERHKKGQNLLKGMGATAPAFGMIGTLIGLVQMLAAMDDPSSIGPAMAVALLTTLYGAVFANLVFLPMADKLDLRSKEETLNRELILAGVESIARGENPRLIEQHLKVFLAPKIRPSEDKEK